MNPLKMYLWALIAITVVVVPIPLISRFTTAHLFTEIDTVAQRAKVVGYSREEFGQGWARQPSGCTTREELMADTYGQESCSVHYAQWEPVTVTDPYTGDPLPPHDVEIDHLFPLSAAWDMGAHSWPEEKRLVFANDPANLIVTSSAENQSKSDQLPSEWMPAANQCEYATRLSTITTAYSLTLTHADITAMRQACSRLRFG